MSSLYVIELITTDTSPIIPVPLDVGKRSEAVFDRRLK